MIFLKKPDILDTINNIKPDIHNTIIAETIIMLYIKTIKESHRDENDTIYKNTYYLLSFNFQEICEENLGIEYRDMNEPFDRVYPEFVPHIVDELNRDFKGILKIVNSCPMVSHKIVFGRKQDSYKVFLKASPTK